MKYIIYTDGSCLGNKEGAGCPGGWAYDIYDFKHALTVCNSGSCTSVTNNQMELMAALRGLQGLKRWCRHKRKEISKIEVIIRTDSKYVSSNVELLDTWEKKGWKKSNGQPVLNVEYWKQIAQLTPEFGKCTYEWVKAHSDNKYNNIVDKRANEMAHSVQVPKK